MFNQSLATELQNKFHTAAVYAGAEWAVAEIHSAKKGEDLDTMVVQMIVSGKKQTYETKVYPNPNTSTDEMEYVIKQWVAKAQEAEEKEKPKPVQAPEKKTDDERAKAADDKEIKEKK